MPLTPSPEPAQPPPNPLAVCRLELELVELGHAGHGDLLCGANRGTPNVSIAWYRPLENVLFQLGCLMTQRGAYRSKRPRSSMWDSALLNCPGLPLRTCGRARRPRTAVPNGTLNSGGGGPSGCIGLCQTLPVNSRRRPPALPLRKRRPRTTLPNGTNSRGGGPSGVVCGRPPALPLRTRRPRTTLPNGTNSGGGGPSGWVGLCPKQRPGAASRNSVVQNSNQTWGSRSLTAVPNRTNMWGGGPSGWVGLHPKGRPGSASWQSAWWNGSWTWGSRTSVQKRWNACGKSIGNSNRALGYRILDGNTWNACGRASLGHFWGYRRDGGWLEECGNRIKVRVGCFCQWLLRVLVKNYGRTAVYNIYNKLDRLQAATAERTWNTAERPHLLLASQIDLP